MRIIAGEFRGRPLATPAGRTIRPTSDRTRESLFDILANRIDFMGLRVIDLFAGTGALGLEALSRGAGFCLFIEHSAEGRALLRQNVERFGLTGRARIWRRDATELGTVGTLAPFDVAFADPPYGRGLGERAAASLARGGWLRHGALFVLEEAKDKLPPALDGYDLADRRDFGDTAIGFFGFSRREQPA